MQAAAATVLLLLTAGACRRGMAFPLPAPYAITDPGTLPCAKPPLWQHPRNLSTATWRIDRSAADGTIRITIQHAPIQGVSTQAMVWLFQHMDKRVADPRTGQQHQVFVLMHPTDNVGFHYSPSPLQINPTNPAAGSAWVFSHFYAAGCTAHHTAQGPQVSCPVQRQALTCRSAAAAVQAELSHTSTQYYARRLDTRGFQAVYLAGGPGPTRLQFMTVDYTWAQTGDGALSITQDIALGVPGLLLSKPLNVVGASKLLSDRSSGEADVDLGLAKLVLHEVEIVGFYEQWLPAVYAAHLV